MIIADFLIKPIVLFPTWYQKNIITFNLQQMISGPISSDEINWVEKKEKGNLIIKQKSPKKIILLVLEGFSQAYLDKGLAPSIRSLSTQGLHVPYFINNQVQTNRGLYALLCGKYPNIFNFEAKSDIFINKNLSYKCLPESLKENQFTNYFMQSAPLPFMRKDLFAKKAGFHFAAGSDSFDSKFILSEWGISDNALLSGALKVIKENHDKNIFLSLLTVGTHHPYVTPESKNSLTKAVQYTDKIVGEFYTQLKKMDYFNDGILIITSDETKTIKPQSNILKFHNGLMIILGDHIPPIRHKNFFSQIDLKSSIRDLFQKDFKGRSLFRSYTNEYSIFIGNAFLNKLLFIKSNKEYHICDHQFNCKRLNFKDHVFHDHFEYQDSSATITKMVKGFISKNDLNFEKEQVYFQEKNKLIAKSKTYTLLGDFKTSPSINKNIQIKIKVKDLETVDLSKVEFIHAYYPCGIPNERVLFKFNLSSKINNINQLLKIKKKHQNKMLCHMTSIKNLSNSDFTLASFSLERASI
ncbi:MAG: LTA synthase family protein [Halobacteriovoraceae bacterium]|nr:LTA synthase family protein [Halobacteriovoraceae bacterium]